MHKHADTQTDTNMQTQTCRHRQTQTRRCTDRHKHADRYRQTDTNMQTCDRHKHADTQTQTCRQIQTSRHKHVDTRTDTNMQTRVSFALFFLFYCCWYFVLLRVILPFFQPLPILPTATPNPSPGLPIIIFFHSH